MDCEIAACQEISGDQFDEDRKMTMMMFFHVFEF